MLKLPARRSSVCQLVLSICALVLGQASARGDDTAPTDSPAAQVVDRAKVQARLKRAEEATDLDPDTKAKLVDLFKQTLEQLRLGDDWTNKAAAWQQRRKTDPEDLARKKARLDQPPADPTPEQVEHPTLAQREQQLADAEAALKKAQRELTEAEAEPKRRRAELPDLLKVAQQRLKDVDQEFAGLPVATEGQELVEARRDYLLAQRRAVQAELAAYDNERVWYEASTELIAARQDVAALAVREAEAAAKRQRDLLNEERKQEALKQAEEARRTAVAALPELKVLADKNAQLTQEHNGPEGFPAKIAAMAKEVDDLRKERVSIDAKYTRVKDRIEAAGLTEAIGLVLQKQLADLPDLRMHRQRLRARQAEVSHVRAQLIELEDQRAELNDPEIQVRKVMDTVDPQLLPFERDEIESSLRELLKARGIYLDSQIASANAYFDGLAIDLNAAEQELIDKIEVYQQFINERILWIRSAPAVGLIDFRRAWDGLVKLADTQQALVIVRELRDDFRENPGIYVAAGLLLLPLVGAQRRLRRRIYSVDQKTAQAYAAEIRPTLEVLVLTSLIAVVWPGLIAFLAWRISAPAKASLHAQSIAYGLRVAAISFLSLEIVRQMCRSKGLAEAHFGWPTDGLARVRRHLHWGMLLGLPCCFIVAVVESPEFDIHRSPLGRLVFIVALVLLSIFAHYVLHPSRGLLQNIAERQDVSWFWRQPRAWYVAAVVGPLSLSVVAALGYFYTAVQLAGRLHATMWLLVGLLVAQAFAQRCLLVARRKLAIKQARERRAAALSQAQQGHHVSHPAHSGQHPVHPSAGDAVSGSGAGPVDLVTIDVQTRRLLRSSINVALVFGCWLIWIDVMPALGILDRFELWQYTPAGAVKSGAGEVAAMKWITLGDVLLGGVILFVTVVAGRNLPGLLEIAFLQRLPMDPGGRYAITTVSRYVITLVGVAVAFWMIGIGWTNIQWLVAAMTVGLGFGLQEIFANFVSGLIILFERPMRVGDVVTIGGTSGSVSKIRIRATTITDGDRKELIVPNKEFITGQLINWTLTDSILRMVIQVGVAFGSDIAHARQLLLQAARDDNRVLRDPPPTAVLDQFGDSTLRFELRVFVCGLDAFADIRHDLNTRVDQLFREAGIEMAFPQRDVHVRSVATGLNVLPLPSEPLKRAG